MSQDTQNKTNKNNARSLPFEKKAEIREEAMKVFHVNQDEMHSSSQTFKKGREGS